MSYFVLGTIIGALIASSLLAAFVLYTLSQTLGVLSGKYQESEDDNN